MRVFFLCSWYPNKNNIIDGLFLQKMAEAIALYNQVTVFYIGEDRDLTVPSRQERTRENGVITIRLYHRPIQTGFKLLDIVLNSVKEIWLMARLVRDEFARGRPDIFHLNVVTPKVIILWFYKFFHLIPFVYSEHWDIPIRVRFGLMNSWLRWRIGMRLSALFSSKVIVCSQAMREAFRYYGLAQDIDIISNVVRVQTKDFQDTARLQAPRVLLHISSLDTAQKNVYGLINATEKLSSRRSDFELHILGKGKELTALRQYTQSKGLLDHHIFFHGYVSDEEKEQWIKRSICHVIFSNFEGQSVVTGESLCYGRPVIATRCGGPEDFVNDSNGILIDPRDEAALTEAMNKILDTYGRLDPEKIRKDANRIFSPSSVGDEHSKLYHLILNKAKK